MISLQDLKAFVKQCQQTIKLMKQFNKKLEIDGDFTNDSKRI